MPRFTSAHFPREMNEEYVSSGTRSQWSILDRSYRVNRDTIIYDNDIRIHVSEESDIKIEQPARLYSHKEIGAPRGTYCRVKYNKMSGFIRVSHIEKPSNPSVRMKAGHLAQEAVRDEFESNSFELISSAKIGSKAPDLVFSGPEGLSQFEVKSRASPSAPITIFDKSVYEDRVPELFDTISDTFIDNLEISVEKGEGSFVRIMKECQGTDDKIGFASEECSPKTGRIPSLFSTDNHEICSVGRDIILDHLHGSNDNYFAVYSRDGCGIMNYHTGLGENPLNSPEFPQVQHFSLNTYGGSTTSGATRIGLKIKI